MASPCWITSAGRIRTPEISSLAPIESSRETGEQRPAEQHGGIEDRGAAVDRQDGEGRCSSSLTTPRPCRTARWLPPEPGGHPPSPDQNRSKRHRAGSGWEAGRCRLSDISRKSPRKTDCILEASVYQGFKLPDRRTCAVSASPAKTSKPWHGICGVAPRRSASPVASDEPRRSALSGIIPVSHERLAPGSHRLSHPVQFVAR